MVPDVPLGGFSTGGCVDEREAVLFLDVLEDVREDRLQDYWNGGPGRLVDGGRSHDETGSAANAGGRCQPLLYTQSRSRSKTAVLGVHSTGRSTRSSPLDGFSVHIGSAGQGPPPISRYTLLAIS